MRGSGEHLLHGAQIPVKLFPLLLWQRGGINGRAGNLRAGFWQSCCLLNHRRIREKRVREGWRLKCGSIRWEQGQGKFPIKRVSLQVDDADVYYEEWRARTEIRRPPKNEEWGARTFDVIDPFGNTIFVIGPTR